MAEGTAAVGVGAVEGGTVTGIGAGVDVGSARQKGGLTEDVVAAAGVGAVEGGTVAAKGGGGRRPDSSMDAAAHCRAHTRGIDVLG